MKWRGLTETIAESECGRYQIHMAREPRSRKQFYNAWYVPTNKHIDASHDKKKVIAACVQHAESQLVRDVA